MSKVGFNMSKNDIYLQTPFLEKLVAFNNGIQVKIITIKRWGFH